jgi:phosphate-selective porin
MLMQLPRSAPVVLCLLMLAAPVVAQDVATRGGTAGKLSWVSDDGKWSLGFGGRIQVRLEVEQGESGNRADDRINFSIPRGRLRFSGKAGAEHLTYKLEIDTPTQDKAVDAGKGGSSSQRKSFKVNDAWLKWKLADSASVKFGQYKFPFGREVHVASTRINLVNASIASKAFSPAREPGVMIYGSVGEDELLEYSAGLSNGDGHSGGNNSGVAGTSTTGLRHGVRLVFQPMGKVDLDGAAFQTVGDGSTRLAIGASWMRNIDVISDTVAGTTPSSDDTTVGLELHVVSGPMSFLAEHFARRMDFGSAGPDLEDDGFNAQLGVFVVPSEVELVLRRSDLDLAGKVGSDKQESTFGLNIYSDKHNAKWTFDLSSTQHPNALKKDSLRARVQYQLVF